MVGVTNRHNLYYKSGEYITCISNTGGMKFVVLQDNTPIGIPIEYNEVLPLTIGKRYKVISHGYNISIENDLGFKTSYKPDIFSKITIEEWRDIQLEKILNK